MSARTGRATPATTAEPVGDAATPDLDANDTTSATTSDAPAVTRGADDASAAKGAASDDRGSKGARTAPERAEHAEREGVPIVSVRGLTVTFPERSDVPVVDDVSFDVHPGEIVAIVGRSGSGKSVTARSLIGLAGADGVVTANRLELEGEGVLDLDEAGWRSVRGRRVGFVLQDALTSLDPLRRIGDEVGEALGRVPAAVRRERVASALRRAGIVDPEVRSRQYAHQLSGGLRQRALIASAIVNDPRLLVADEPTTALDVTVQRHVLELLRGLAAEGRGVLLITHDLAVVAQIASRVLVLHHGRIVESGPVEEVLTNPTDPYTRRLLTAIPSEHNRGERLSVDPDLARAEDEGPRDRSLAADTTREAAPLLVVDDASVVFPGPRRSRRRALDGVSIRIAPGETLGVVGESGSGKSTLGRAVLGLQRLDSGSVELFGEPWSALPERRRRPLRRRVQVISQDPLGSFDPRLTVGQLLDQPLRLGSSGSAAERRTEAGRLLGLVDLDDDLLRERPGRLSGGQRQRVAIAQALASDPELLVADEPVSALDVLTQAQVLDLLVDLQARVGLAMLFISHDLGVVQHLSHRIAVMKEGRVVETGSVDEVFARPRHPYTVELFEAVPRIGVRRGESS